MKLTKRDKNSIIIVFSFNLLVFLISIYYVTSYFYPEIKSIEERKLELRELYENKVNIEKKGITLKDYKKLNKDTNDEYFKNVVTNLSEDFYNNNFINKGDGSYNEFINTKIEEVNSDEYLDILDNQNTQITDLLPSYKEFYEGNESSILTNFKFINYVESIIATFNLKTSDKIGISNIELLGDYEDISGINKNIESNIFAIPLKLTLDGKKAQILDFLYFANNVGKISITDGEFEVISDDSYVGKQWLRGDYLNNNIFKNQLFDIEYIKFGEYIDSSINFREYQDFIDFIKSEQSYQDYSIDIKLNFYVKGIEKFEIVKYIKKVINTYNDLNKSVNNILSKKSFEKYDELNYKKANTYLTEIKKDMANLQKDLNKGTNLDQLYSRALKYEISFSQINKLIK